VSRLEESVSDVDPLNLTELDARDSGSSRGSATASTVQSLQDDGAAVYYQPQVDFQPANQIEVTVGSSRTQLTAYGVPGARYQLQASANLVDWAVLATVISTDTVTSFDVDPTASACFYRIRVPQP
jgi:hypothetical protein